jgi:subtilase family serine protease
MFNRTFCRFAAVTAASLGLCMVSFSSANAVTGAPRWVGPADLSAPKYFTVNLRPGSSQADARIVGNYLRRFGLVVDDRNSLVIFSHGTYAQAAAAAHTSFAVAEFGGSNFVHTTAAPTFPNAVATRIVATTLDEGPPLRHSAIIPDFTLEPQYGYTPSDMATYYDAASVYSGGNTGQGENVAVIDCGEYFGESVLGFEHIFSLRSYSPSVVLVDQTTTTESIFPTFDIEAIDGPAPGATITEYAIPVNCDAQNFADALAKIYADNATKHYVAVDDDYSESEDFYDSTGQDSILMAEHTDIKNLALAGVAVFADTGLWGAGPSPGSALSAGEITVEYPSSDPYAIGVGGTTAIPTSTFTRMFEIAWGGSGGGVSHEFNIPLYQKGVSGIASTTNRNVPDVAYNADQNTCWNTYLQSNPRVRPANVCDSGTGTGVGAWTAFTALVDEARVAASKKPLATLYKELYAEQSAGIFVPIKRGCNDYYCASALTYNNVTGLGVPDVAKLVSTLTGLP